MIQILNICNSCCGYYYYFPLRAVKDGLSTSLLFLSASLSTHGWLHASKRRVVVLAVLVVGGGVERTETEERCWKGQAFNEQENMWASP